MLICRPEFIFSGLGLFGAHSHNKLCPPIMFEGVHSKFIGASWSTGAA